MQAKQRQTVDVDDLIQNVKIARYNLVVLVDCEIENLFLEIDWKTQHEIKWQRIKWDKSLEIKCLTFEWNKYLNSLFLRRISEQKWKKLHAQLKSLQDYTMKVSTKSDM